MAISSRVSNYIILALLSPAAALYHSTKKLSWRDKKWVLILIITLFGSLVPIVRMGDGSRGSNVSDGSYMKEIIYDHYLELSFSQWWFEFTEIIKLSPEPGGFQYVFNHVIGFLLGFLGVPELLFVVVAFIFGYFYINALSKILVWSKGRRFSLLAWGLIGIMIIYNGVDHIQSIRTWTGAWVLFNGVFGYYDTGKKKYLWLMLAAPLFHNAYLAMAFPAYAAIFLTRLPSLFIVGVFITSFFININPAGLLDQVSSTEWGESKIKSYYKEEVGDVQYDILRSDDERNFYVKYGKFQSHHWGANFLAFTLILSGLYRKNKLTKLENGLLVTGLLVASAANLGDFVHSFYNRTMSNAGIYLVAVTTLLLLRNQLLPQGHPQLLFRKGMIAISLVIFIPYILYTAANMLLYTSVFMFLLPFVGWSGGEAIITLREIIGDLLGIG